MLITFLKNPDKLKKYLVNRGRIVLVLGVVSFRFSFFNKLKISVLGGL